MQARFSLVINSPALASVTKYNERRKHRLASSDSTGPYETWPLASQALRQSLTRSFSSCGSMENSESAVGGSRWSITCFSISVAPSAQPAIATAVPVSCPGSSCPVLLSQGRAGADECLCSQSRSVKCRCSAKKQTARSSLYASLCRYPNKK